MKYILTFLIIVLFSNFVKSQDLILTRKGDSINCKIKKVTNDEIYFSFNQNSELKNTLITKDKVVTFLYDFYIKKETKNNKNIKQYPNFRINLICGYGKLTGGFLKEDTSVPSSYYKKLQTGYNFGGDINYFFTKNFGLGLKFNCFNVRNKMEGLEFHIHGDTIIGKVEDNITENYFAPSFLVRHITKNEKLCLLAAISYGYTFYTDKKTFISQYEKTSKAYVLSGLVGFDYFFENNISLGVDLTYYYGYLNQYDISDGKTKTRISLNSKNYDFLSRFDVNFGIKYYF